MTVSHTEPDTAREWRKTFTFLHLADAFIQSDFQERVLKSA